MILKVCSYNQTLCDIVVCEQHVCNARCRARIKRACMLAYVMAAFCMLFLLSACTQAENVNVGETSPRLVDVALSAQSSMTEASQKVEVVLTFDKAISAQNTDVSNAIDVQLNGKAPDEHTVMVNAQIQENTVVVTFQPAESVRNASNKTGDYFALYQSAFCIRSSRSDGALVGIVGEDGQAAVLDVPVEGVLPSGLAIEVISQQEGLASEGVRATCEFRVTSTACVRAITWFSVDGGTTKLLKHNHTFARATCADAALDLARVINKAKCGINAQATGDTVTLTATSVIDGQDICPLVVEGVNASPGVYDASSDEA